MLITLLQSVLPVFIFDGEIAPRGALVLVTNHIGYHLVLLLFSR